MFRDAADCEAAHQRFLTRVANPEVVWSLKSDSGYAYCESDEDIDDETKEVRDVLLFWSDRGYASRARQQSFPDYQAFEMSLLDFLFRWLPGLAEDGELAGPNWTGDLVGFEVEPAELQNQLFAAMGDERVKEYRARLEHALEQQGGAP